MKTIDVEEMSRMMREGDHFMLINVLDEDEFHRHHIPGSRNVPIGDSDFVEKVEAMAGSKDMPIVVYCANRECSASPTAAKKLEQAGFTDVIDFADGIEAWENADKSVEKGPMV